MTVKHTSVLEGKLSHAKSMIDNEKQKQRGAEICISTMGKNLKHIGYILAD
jgi:hypothetical protein